MWVFCVNDFVANPLISVQLRSDSVKKRKLLKHWINQQTHTAAFSCTISKLMNSGLQEISVFVFGSERVSCFHLGRLYLFVMALFRALSSVCSNNPFKSCVLLDVKANEECSLRLSFTNLKCVHI